MSSSQEQYDDAMFAFSTGDYDDCINRLRALLEAEPENFDAQLAVGMAYCRKGDFETAIAEGHKAEKMRPTEQLVHTNLSLFYMRKGDKQTAEHHGLQARVASWKGNMNAPATKADAPADPELSLAKPAPANIVVSGKFPDMPWKKNKPIKG